MKSQVQTVIPKKIEQKKSFWDKRGQLGISAVTGVILGLVFLVVSVVVGFLIISTLRNAGLFGASSAEANATQNISLSLINGVIVFFSFLAVIFTVLAVVVLMTFLGFLLAFLFRFTRGGGSGGSKL